MLVIVNTGVIVLFLLFVAAVGDGGIIREIIILMLLVKGN